MAIDKGAPLAIFTAETVTAATSESSSWLNFLEKQAATTYVRVTNGGTGPDERPNVVIEVADDVAGTNAREVFRVATGTANALVTDVHHAHAITDRYVRVTVENDGDQDVTVDAHAHFVDHLG